MKRRNSNIKQRSEGFTLAELLIVVAVIAVLVAIGIPVFSRQLEKSRESTDLANARAAYTQVVCAAIQDLREASPMYDATDKTYKMEIALRQKQDGWQTTSFAKLTVADVTPEDRSGRWIGSPLKNGTCTLIYYIADDKLVINWQGDGDPNYMSAAAPYQFESLMSLKGAPNSERIAADQTTLTAIGNEILRMCAENNWNVSEVKKNLGIYSQGNTVRIANYYQLKDGSYDEGASYSSAGFRITSEDALLTALDSMGYIKGNVISSENVAYTATNTNSTKNAVDSVFENSLFFSDELATNKFTDKNGNIDIDKTMRSILLFDFTESNGVVTGFKIQTKAMDNESDLTTTQRDRDFTITVSANG